MATVRERIICFIEKQSIKPEEFLLKTGLGEGFIDRSNQAFGATDVHLYKILGSYPELSPEWLLAGKGSMLRSESPQALQGEIAEEHRIRILENKIRLLEKTIARLDSNMHLQNKVIGRLLENGFFHAE